MESTWAITFQVVVDFQHGQHEAQVDGHGVVEGDDVLHVAVYLQLKSIDAAFAYAYLLRQFTVGSQYGVARTLQLVVDQGPHLVYFLLQQDELRFYEFHHIIVGFKLVK